jgi:hypothetical protein
VLPHPSFTQLSSLYLEYFIMDSPKSKKPSLPRLETDISPPPRPASTSLPLAPVVLQGSNLQRIESAPGLFADTTKEENVVPTVRHAPDAKAFSVAEKTVGEAPVAKKKTQYYEEVFGHRGSHNSPSERVHQDSVVVAELKTNHKVHLYPIFDFRLRSLIAVSGQG